ncbi:hypothetical protein EV702DRAFT_1051260 [Suillus placidus]|uniref:Uncharacterized protein n=1 Tax=Suillus placidus TaxID=48579 RepID=A0A9P6ZG49_9AGAM|nr:hypothetical protein EV702DRAFT_1051260 [Suillus placidus]
MTRKASVSSSVRDFIAFFNSMIISSSGMFVKEWCRGLRLTKILKAKAPARVLRTTWSYPHRRLRLSTLGTTFLPFPRSKRPGFLVERNWSLRPPPQGGLCNPLAHLHEVSSCQATLPPCIRLRTSSVSFPSPQEAQRYPRKPPHGLVRYHQEGNPASLSGLIESPESPSTLYQASPVVIQVFQCTKTISVLEDVLDETSRLCNCYTGIDITKYKHSSYQWCIGGVRECERVHWIYERVRGRMQEGMREDARGCAGCMRGSSLGRVSRSSVARAAQSHAPHRVYQAHSGASRPFLLGGGHMKV